MQYAGAKLQHFSSRALPYVVWPSSAREAPECHESTHAEVRCRRYKYNEGPYRVKPQRGSQSIVTRAARVRQIERSGIEYVSDEIAGSHLQFDWELL